MTNSFIPFAQPDIGDEEVAEVVDTLRSGWLTTGRKVQAFEEAFSQAVAARHAMAVNSATGGLHLALEAVGVGENDRVLTPVWTFTATAEVSRYLGAHPEFVDADPVTLNVDIRFAEECAGRLVKSGIRPRAIVPVHFAGRACDMQTIMDLAAEFDLKVVEDAAHAFPASCLSRSVSDPNIRLRNIGTIGHATVFSFYTTKTIATGEGGMVTTDDPDLAVRTRLMRLHGISRDVWDRYTSKKPSWYYEVIEPGYKYNLTDIAAGIGLQQLKKADRFLARRKSIAEAYTQAFAGHPALEPPPSPPPDHVHSWHLYVLRLNLDALSIDRDRFIAEMMQREIGCSVHFIPLHLHPYWRDRYDLRPDMFPVASREFSRVVSLPIYPKMNERAVSRVIESVLETARAHRR